MSAEKISEYMDRIERAPPGVVRQRILMEAARDGELTLTELLRLDNWARRQGKTQGRATTQGRPYGGKDGR